MPADKNQFPNDHRQSLANRNLLDGLASDPRVLTCGVTAGGVEHVQQMVTYPAALGHRSLGGADVEIPVELKGIAIDDLARKFLAYAQCERAFARARRTGNDNQGGFRSGSTCLSWYPAGPAKPIY